MEKRKKWLIRILVGCAVALFTAIFIFPQAVLFIGLGCTWLQSDEPLKPDITRAEFVIALEYEQDGTKKISKDTMICEYDGIGVDVAYHKCHEWTCSLASGEEGLVIWTGKNSKGQEERLWYFYDDNPGYYMGDPDYSMDSDYQGEIEADGYVVKEYKNILGKWEKEDFITDEEEDEKEVEEILLDMYGIKLIRYECDLPIENTFK